MRASPTLRNFGKVQTDRIHPSIPLALLEAVRFLDGLAPSGIGKYGDEIASNRLGTNPTVTAQIERYRQLERKGAYVDCNDVVQLFELVNRRNDAAMTLGNAGRWAARRATRRISLTARVLRRAVPGLFRSRMGFAAARRLAEKVFAIKMEQGKGGVVAVRYFQSHGDTCEFYGAVLAELMRCLTDFDGAMLHEACRARGDDECRWQTATDIKR